MRRKIVYTFLLLIGFKLSSFSQNGYDTALIKAVQFLENSQRNDGAICQPENNLFEIWETIESIHALVQAKGDTLSLPIQSGLKFIRENLNSNGLICHNSKCKNEFCIETSSELILLYNKIGLSKYANKAIQRIISQQLSNGSWNVGNPDVNEIVDFPSVTAFALATLNDIDSVNYKIEKGFIFLNRLQLKNGDWGSHWEYYGCKAYACWAVSQAIYSFSKSKNKAMKKKLKAFILKSQRSNGSWDDFHEGIEFNRVSSEFQTSLMLLALLNLDESPHSKFIKKGVNYLLNNQQSNGSWNGGLFPIPKQNYIKKEDVFVTTKVIQILKRLNESTTK